MTEILIGNYRSSELTFSIGEIFLKIIS